MRSPGNARKSQIWPVSLSQNSAKMTKVNRPWPRTNQFWRWSRYISMQNFRPFPLCVLQEMPGWTNGPTDPCTGQKRVFQASDGRTDGQPENIMPPAPKGGGIKKANTERMQHIKSNAMETDILIFALLRQQTVNDIFLSDDVYIRCDVIWGFHLDLRLHETLVLREWDLPWKHHWKGETFNTLRPRENGRHFADIFKCIFLNENVWIPVEISLRFVVKGPINNITALVQIMAWRRSGDKPLSEPMMVGLTTHICVTRPQWVNSLAPGRFWWYFEYQ